MNRRTVLCYLINAYAQDRVVTKANAGYLLSAPVVDFDGITVSKSEYKVTYKADDTEVKSSTKLSLANIGDSVTVNAEIRAKTDKNGKATIILNAVDGSEKCFGSRTHNFNIVKGIMRWVK